MHAIAPREKTHKRYRNDPEKESEIFAEHGEGGGHYRSH